MKESTKKWLEYMDGDLEAAESLFANGEKMGHGYQIAVYHCHQAVEKVLKAVLCEKEKDILKIHDLVKLVGMTEVIPSQEVDTFIAALNPHYQPTRYPDLGFRPKFSFTYNRHNTRNILNQTKQTILWFKQQLA